MPNIGKTPNSFLSNHQVETCFKSSGHAFVSQRHLNTYMVLSANSVSSTQLRDFNHHMVEFLRYSTGNPASYVYTLENDTHLHLNQLLHLPDALLTDFTSLSRGWLAQCQIPSEDKTLKHFPIAHSGSDADPILYLKVGLLNRLRYILKGCDASTASGFGINAKPQGIVAGKRCGCSQSSQFLSPEFQSHARYATLKIAWGDPHSRTFIPIFPVPEIRSQVHDRTQS